MGRKPKPLKKCQHCGVMFHPQHHAPGYYCSNKCSAVANARPLKERFYDMFIPEPNSGCWLWTGSLFRLGYGNVKANGKMRSAHRVSYEMHVGPIGDKHVLHRCDTRCCVNPDHLFLGTHAENMADMDRKGRRRPGAGENHGGAKLTDAIVLAARSSGMTPLELAETAGVHKSTARRALSGERWGHL